MSRHNPTVAFDFSGLDHLNPGNGQYRYCTDLIRGLARLQSGITFIVIGSQPTPPADVADVFNIAGWRYVHLPRLSMRGAYYADLIRFAWLLRRERVDVFHTPHTFVPTRFSWHAVVTVYDLMSEMFPEYAERVASRPYQRFRKSVRDPRTRVIAISQTTARDLERYWGVAGPRVSVVPIGVEIADARSPEDGALRGLADTTFVLSPYNLEPRKNLRALLVAMADVRRDHPTIKLVLYGRAAVTPEREEAFRAQVRDLGLSDAIVLTGFIRDESLAWLYRAASLFVFPTLYEGFGIPVLEAMAAGACVVTRNQSAMAEVLGEAGVQVETRDPHALSAAITALLGDAQRRSALGRAARERAARFTQEAMARQTLAVYRHALAGR
jgi:glycosyltransferase involved in cell wall biosynthesis